MAGPFLCPSPGRPIFQIGSTSTLAVSGLSSPFPCPYPQKDEPQLRKVCFHMPFASYFIIVTNTVISCTSVTRKPQAQEPFLRVEHALVPRSSCRHLRQNCQAGLRVESLCFRVWGSRCIQIASAPSPLLDPCNLGLVGSHNVAFWTIAIMRFAQIRRGLGEWRARAPQWQFPQFFWG